MERQGWTEPGQRATTSPRHRQPSAKRPRRQVQRKKTRRREARRHSRRGSGVRMRDSVSTAHRWRPWRAAGAEAPVAASASDTPRRTLPPIAPGQPLSAKVSSHSFTESSQSFYFLAVRNAQMRRNGVKRMGRDLVRQVTTLRSGASEAARCRRERAPAVTALGAATRPRTGSRPVSPSVRPRLRARRGRGFQPPALRAWSRSELDHHR